MSLGIQMYSTVENHTWALEQENQYYVQIT